VEVLHRPELVIRRICHPARIMAKTDTQKKTGRVPEPMPENAKAAHDPRNLVKLDNAQQRRISIRCRRAYP
jgi:hypothetical protein